VKTYVRVTRGLLAGRTGWIAGNLEDRAARGITKAVIHAGADVELLPIENLRPDDQPGLFPLDEHQDQQDRPAHVDLHGGPGAGRDRADLGALQQLKTQKRTPPARSRRRLTGLNPW
jgi:hypothetical protein